MRGGVLGVAFFVASGVFASAALPAYPPSGFLRFCMEHAVDCSSTPGGASAVELTFENLGILELINSEVNTQIKPMNDAKHYGRAEFWTIPTDGYGDCEDYALTKRRRLMAAGFPSQSLLLAVVETPALGRHAVLTVTTDAGTLVLDNLEPAILRREETKYSWVEHEDSSNLLAWVDYSDRMPVTSVTQGIAPSAPKALAELSVAAIPPAATSTVAAVRQSDITVGLKHHRHGYRSHRVSRHASSKKCALMVSGSSSAACRTSSVVASAEHAAPASRKAPRGTALSSTSSHHWFGRTTR